MFVLCVWHSRVEGLYVGSVLKLMRCNEVCQCIGVCRLFFIFLTWHVAMRLACRETLKSTTNSSCRRFVDHHGAKGGVFTHEQLRKLPHLFLVIDVTLLYFHLIATALKPDRELPERHWGDLQCNISARCVSVLDDDVLDVWFYLCHLQFVFVSVDYS